MGAERDKKESNRLGLEQGVRTGSFLGESQLLGAPGMRGIASKGAGLAQPWDQWPIEGL